MSSSYKVRFGLRELLVVSRDSVWSKNRAVAYMLKVAFVSKFSDSMVWGFLVLRLDESTT